MSKREAGPVREQPHLVLAEKHVSRPTAPRQAGRPRSRPPARTPEGVVAYGIIYQSEVWAREARTSLELRLSDAVTGCR